jgi:hypothetical protein
MIVDLPRRGISFEILSPGLMRVTEIEREILIQIYTLITIRACDDRLMLVRERRRQRRRLERRARRRGVRPEIVQPFNGYLKPTDRTR